MCWLLKVEWKEFNDMSFRLTKEGRVTIDYFPSTGKVFFHDVKEWSATDNIEQFMKFQFGDKEISE